MRCNRCCYFALSLVLLAQAAALAITIPTVPVGNAGNASNTLLSGYAGGAVAYDYRIGTYEVTNAQYAAFLDAKAKSDPLGLYNETMGFDPRGGITRSGMPGNYSYGAKANMDNKPVTLVGLYSALRFANWLDNGQGNGNTESGAYTLVGGAIPSNSTSITRNAGAQWFLPSKDEWYKAAYYQPASAGGDASNYWLYATRSNTDPTKAFINSPTFDIANPGFNVVNYDSGINFLTSVGSAGPLSASYYGTYDQSGNVYEWTDTRGADPNFWYRMGGSYNSTTAGISSAYVTTYSPGSLFTTSGFRVAAAFSVPEPDSALLALLGLSGLVSAAACSRRSAKPAARRRGPAAARPPRQ